MDFLYWNLATTGILTLHSHLASAATYLSNIIKVYNYTEICTCTCLFYLEFNKVRYNKLCYHCYGCLAWVLYYDFLHDSTLHAKWWSKLFSQNVWHCTPTFCSAGREIEKLVHSECHKTKIYCNFIFIKHLDDRLYHCLLLCKFHIISFLFVIDICILNF